MNDTERLEHLLRLVAELVRPQRIAGVLGDGESDAPGMLVPLASARAAVERRRGAGLRSVSPPARRGLARRALLGRRADDIEALAGLWAPNGTPQSVVAKAVEAARAGGLPPQNTVLDLSRVDLQGLSGHDHYASFARALGEIEREDARGPLGDAVRSSRYGGGDRRTVARPFLAGEARRPVGFPVALGQGTASCLCDGAWVEPVRSWPGWLLLGVQVAAELRDQISVCQELRSKWAGLSARINDLLRTSGYTARLADSALPEWLLLFVACYGVEDVESAGLALALQALAASEDWPLPAGVGFTGRWGDDGRLLPVGRIAEKARAARDGGIFILFACTEPGRPPAASEDGIALAALPPGASLVEVVRLVNTTCHALGLTADRADWVSEEQRRHCRSVRPGRAASALLPEAAATSCLPVGFVGRERELGLLKEWASERATGTRRMAVLEGDMRAGKTTLAARWLQERGVWPDYPVWFSCVRGHPRASRCEHVRTGLTDQITARYRLLPIPATPTEEGSEGDRSDRWSQRVREACAATDAQIDLVVDGLDELLEQDQRAVIDLITSLPGQGLALVVSQAGTPALDGVREARRITLRQDREAARCLITEFAEKWRSRPDLRDLAARLAQWREDLVDRSGGNLWVLTELLASVLNGTAVVPESLDHFRLRPAVKDYVLEVFAEILESAPSGTRAKLRGIVRALALLDIGEAPWPTSDLLRVCPSTLGAEDLEEATEGPLKRLVHLQGGGLQFRDETFRQVIAADGLEQDRNKGRDLALALAKVLAPEGEPPSPFLVDFATAHAATFALRYAEGDGSLALRLLVRAPWPARRFRQVTFDTPFLGAFLEELRGLFQAASAAEQPGDLGSVCDLLETLAHWRPAIEAGRACSDDWWPRLRAVASGKITASAPSATRKENSRTALLYPAGGYSSPTPGYCQLNGAACVVNDGGTERIALAATHGRLLAYVKRDGAWVFERLHFFETGAIAKLVEMDGNFALALTRTPGGGEGGMVIHLSAALAPEPSPVLETGPGQSDQQRHRQSAIRRRLWLVDVASPLPPVEIEVPSETVDFAVLRAGGGLAVIVLAIDVDQETEMRSYLLHYERGQTAFLPLQLTVDGGIARTKHPVKRLCKFAPDTWAAVGVIGGDGRGDSILTVHRHSQGGIADLTQPAIFEVLRGSFITGVCPLPDSRLAAVCMPTATSRESATLLIVTQDGKVELQLPITPIPHPRVEVSLASEVDSCAHYQPLGWHQHLHLLLGHSHSAYHCLTLQAIVDPENWTTS